MYYILYVICCVICLLYIICYVFIIYYIVYIIYIMAKKDQWLSETRAGGGSGLRSGIGKLFGVTKCSVC